MSQICALLFPLQRETVCPTRPDLLFEDLKDPRLVLCLTERSLAVPGSPGEWTLVPVSHSAFAV